MKTSDYISLGFIAVFVTIVAYFLLNSIMGNPKDATVRVQYLTGVSSDLSTPDSEIFNAAAVNPTVEVYVGNCVDQDGDGILSEKEKRDCGLSTETDTGVTESETEETSGGLSDEENEQINRENGYASGTTAEQREAVENDVNDYSQQQQQNNAANASDAAARQETVSGN